MAHADTRIVDERIADARPIVSRRHDEVIQDIHEHHLGEEEAVAGVFHKLRVARRHDAGIRRVGQYVEHFLRFPTIHGVVDRDADDIPVGMRGVICRGLLHEELGTMHHKYAGILLLE